MLNSFGNIQNSGSQLYKNFTFEEEHIVIQTQLYPYKVQIQFILK